MEKTVRHSDLEAFRRFLDQPGLEGLSPEQAVREFREKLEQSDETSGKTKRRTPVI